MDAVIPWSSLFNGFIGVAAVFVAGAVVNLVRKRREQAKDGSDDMSDLTDFLFDKPPNPRTRTPGQKGWTTRVNEQLEEHGRQIGDTLSLVQEIHTELPKLHDAVSQGAQAAKAAERRAGEAVEAAKVEASLQVEERERVAQREAERDAR